MPEATLPSRARGLLVPGAIVAALVALLAFAPLASATPDPVAKGTTTMTIDKGLAKQLKRAGVSFTTTGPAKLKGSRATFPVRGGSLDPTSGVGTLTHGGGIRVKSGEKQVPITALEINTATKSVAAKVAGKKMKVFKLAGVSFTRNGFGVNLSAKSLKITANAAVALDKKLAPAPAKMKGKAGKSGAVPVLFKANANFGSSKSEEQPKTVTLLPGGAVTFVLNAELANKLNNVEAKLNPLTGTTVINPTTFSFPVTGGTFAPNGTAGVGQSAGGLLLSQKLPLDEAGTKNLETAITLAGFQYDLATKFITAEVSATSNASKELNLGALGRSSVADVTIGGVLADPTTRSVSVQNSYAVLQALSGEVLNGFVKVYASWYEGVLKAKGASAQEAKEGAARKAAENAIAGGNPLGLISFVGQAQ